MSDPEKPILSYATNRAKEPTTWAGLATLAASAWIAFTTGDMNTALVSAVAAIGGLVSIFRKERK